MKGGSFKPLRRRNSANPYRRSCSPNPRGCDLTFGAQKSRRRKRRKAKELEEAERLVHEIGQDLTRAITAGVWILATAAVVWGAYLLFGGFN